MEFCPSVHCCSVSSSTRREHDSRDAEPSRPVRLPDSQGLVSLQQLPRANSISRPPVRQTSTGTALETVSKETPDTRRISSTIVEFNRPIDLPSDSSTRNFKPIISLRQRDPNMAEEDRKLTLGGDERYMTDPSRMRFSEDIANRNMLSTTSNVYPEPNPPAPRSLPLSVGPNKYGEDVADRVLSQPGSAIQPAVDISVTSPANDSDIRRVSGARDVSDDYYTARFKPTHDAYTPDSTQRNSTSGRAVEISSTDDAPSNYSLAERISRHNSLQDRDYSLGSKESLGNSLPRATSGATSGSSIPLPLSLEEIEAKEVNRMSKDNFYDSRAIHPRDRVRAVGPACAVESGFGEQPGANKSQTLQIVQPKLEQPICPRNQSDAPPSAIQVPVLEITPGRPGAGAATGSLTTQPNDAESPDHFATPPAQTEFVAPGPPSHLPASQLSPGPGMGAPSSTTPSTSAAHRPGPPLDMPSSSTSAPAPSAPAAGPASPLARSLTPNSHVVFEHILPFFDAEPAGAAAAAAAAADGPEPRVRPAGKTWPVRFDTASGAYDGLEQLVAEKRLRLMAVGGLLPRTDTVDRAMPGGWYDGEGRVRVACGQQARRAR